MHLFSMSWLCSCFAIQILAGHRPNGSWIGLVCLLLVFSCYKSVKLNKLLLLQDIPPSAMANIRTVSSLAEVNGVLEEMGIDTIGGANQVQFRLHEQASLNIYPNPPVYPIHLEILFFSFILVFSIFWLYIVFSFLRIQVLSLLLEIKEYLIRQLLLQMKSWMQLFIVISVLRGPFGGPIFAFWR